ncbi:MAG TPA: dipeptidase [Clostridia bacterium]|nr:dipeptidase [Clostridia bacterium]
MLITDAHCDTALSVLESGADFYENGLQLDLKRLYATRERLQFFAAFPDPLNFRYNELPRVLSIIDQVYAAGEKHPDKLRICLDSRDINTAISEGKIAALLSIEGGECLYGQLPILRQLYKLGVRSMLLTWNHRNLLADGAEETHGGGLSVFGRQVVYEMERLGMIIDVSHLCENSFHDVMEIVTKPVIASHSNARAVCDHARNLDDRQLMEIKDNGGVVGINFYTHFLNNTSKATIDDILRHIEHICSVTGEDHIGLGTDYDGIETAPEGLESTHLLPVLFERMAQLNYSSGFIEKFAGLNFLRVIRQVLK